MNNSKNTNFMNQIFKTGIGPNLISSLIMFFFSSFFIAFPAKRIPSAFAIYVVFVVFVQFVLAPFTNKLITKRLSERIEDWQENRRLDEKERTKLLHDVMRYPLLKGTETIIYFLLCTLILCLSYHFIPAINITWPATFMMFFACIFGAYNAALVSVNYSELICNKYGEEIVRQGVDSAYVKQKKHIGISAGLRMYLYMINPAVFVSVLLVLLTAQGYLPVLNRNILGVEQVVRAVLLAVSCVLIAIVLMYLYYQQIKKPNATLRHSISNVLNSNVANPQMDTNLSDELQYNIYLLNDTVRRFNSLIDKASRISNNVMRTTDDLSVISQQLSSTSLEQSADVKEILTTMEDSNAFAQNIAGKINKVSHGTDETKTDVDTGFQLLQESIKQMNEISASNTIIKEGIKSLGQQIDDIGDVVTIINDIADQTRIIAFNAELEAVSAGEEGKNFHIVATEIRRLANSTTNSVHEIQNYIETIQSASQKLIESSENSTNLIEQGSQMTQELETHFTGIKHSAETTSTKTSEISNIIDQQTSSFNQIVITLRQISAGIESFTMSTKIISETATDMQALASRLQKLQDDQA